jgi:GrpB-like predicted nucleotidyltransferase (UPF0157 family)
VAGSVIIIVEYDPHWPDVFDELRAPVVAALGDLVVSVEHVGSTAVPGLAAKPIIDMDAVVPSVVDVPKAIERLALFGYAHRGDLGIPGREAFTSPPGKPGRHLYVCALGSDELSRHRSFRDYVSDNCHCENLTFWLGWPESPAVDLASPGEGPSC